MFQTLQQDLVASLPIQAIFWTIMAIEVVGFAVLMVLASRGRRSPEGPVGGWIVLVPPVIWIVFGAGFYFTSSTSIRTTLTFILAIPLLGVTLGPLVDKLRRAKWARDRRRRADSNA